MARPSRRQSVGYVAHFESGFTGFADKGSVMKNTSGPSQRMFFCWLLIFLCLSLGGCAAGGGTARNAPRVSPDQSLVSVYLSTNGVSAERISLTVDGVALLVGDLWIDLSADAVKLEREKIEGKQMLLGIGAFPTGDCTRIRFNVKDIRVGGDGGPGLEDRQIELPFSRSVALAGNGSTCLFVEWQLAPPAPGEARFVPHFSARSQEVPLGGDLAYVVCDDIDTLYLIRTDVNFVVAALGLPGPLGELVVDPVRRRLYILSSGERAIHVFNSANTQYLDRIPLSIAVKPRHMSLSADGASAFVTDAATNRVMKVDLASRLVAAQATVGFRPERVLAFDDGGGWVAVSSPTAQRISILNAETFALVKEIPAGLEADSLLFWNGQLYVGERGSSSVSSFDYRTGRQLARITVGIEPAYLLGVDNKIFVSNYRDASLSVFYAGQNATARRVPVGDGPFVLAVSERRRQLYIANRDLHGLTIMDLSGERVKGVIPLGGTPFSIGILD